MATVTEALVDAKNEARQAETRTEIADALLNLNPPTASPGGGPGCGWWGVEGLGLVGFGDFWGCGACGLVG